MGGARPGLCDTLPEMPARELQNGQAHFRDESDLLARPFRMRPSHCTQAQSKASHCRLTSPTEEWLFTEEQLGLLWLVANLHQGHATGSRNIQNGRILAGQPSYVWQVSLCPGPATHSPLIVDVTKDWDWHSALMKRHHAHRNTINTQYKSRFIVAVLYACVL